MYFTIELFLRQVLLDIFYSFLLLTRVCFKLILYIKR
nr:MAG TPA_asm: hypothetical protein [Caudoviricetes sp.]